MRWAASNLRGMADDLRMLALTLASKAVDLAAGTQPDNLERVTIQVPDDADAICSAIKSEAKLRYTLGVAYPAFSPDVAMAMDLHRDFASDETVRKAAWGYLADHRQIGLCAYSAHVDPDMAAGTVVESYLYPSPDPWVIKAADGSEQTIMQGDWLLGVQWTPDAFAAIERGAVDGFSFVGQTQRRKPDAESLARLR